MQKYDDETIMQEVREYWNGHVNKAAKIAKFAFLHRALEQGFDPRLTGSEEITGKLMPDYRSPKPDTAGLLNNKIVALDEIASGILTKLIGECLFDYDKFLGNTDTPIIVSIFGPLRKARDIIIKEHKRHRKIFPTHIKNMKELKYKVNRYRPESNRQVFQDAIDSICCSHRFSELLIDYLDNEWPMSFNLVKNLNKEPKSQPCWNKMMNNMYDILINEAEKPFVPAEACRYIAKFLGLVYPLTWVGDVQPNANLIRNRIDNYKLSLRNT